MKRTLILSYTSEDEVLYKLRGDDVSVKRMFIWGRYTTKLFRVFPILKCKFFLKMFCDEWIKEVKEGKYSTVIISAESIAPHMVRVLKHIDSKLRVIVYYWNCCAVEESPNSFDRALCELWTFDKKDAENYGLNYNPQFCANDLQSMLEDEMYNNVQLEWDIYFIGRDKGRKQKILELESIFNDLNYRTKFLIMRGQVGTIENLRAKRDEKYDKDISYSENIMNVIKSKALLDICIEGQEGLTIRPMEALYLKKKLITNNVSIKDTMFYNKNNIFILGEENWSDFDEFFKSPWIEQTKEVLDYYTGKEWLRRFGV